MAKALGEDLYAVLGVEKTASAADIKKAYRALALRLHPDKNPGDVEASSKFQSLQLVHAILSDPDRRKAYDEHGTVDEDELGEGLSDLVAYFRTLYKPVTEEDVNTFADAYRGSEEEKSDVLRYYAQFKGDMEQVFEWVMCSDSDLDSHRFMDIVDAAVASGDAKTFKTYKAWAKKVASRARPADPLRKSSSHASGSRASDGAGASTSGALVAAAQAKRAAAADAFFDSLAAKYGEPAAKKGRKGKKTEAAPPTDEEFEVLQAKMMARARLEPIVNSNGGQAKSTSGVAKGAKRSRKQNTAEADETADVDENAETGEKGQGKAKKRKAKARD